LKGYELNALVPVAEVMVATTTLWNDSPQHAVLI